MSLSTAIYNLLSSSGSGQPGALFSGKIYFGIAPQGTTLPVLIYNIVGSNANFKSLDMTWTYENRIQMDVWVNTSEGMEQAYTLANSVANLHGSGVSGYSCLLIDSRPVFSPGPQAIRATIQARLLQQD